ncbi:hypothetical protein LCGC14_1921000 [marine sediment metagenome]|uniref:Uncharacterized protein n=1 Tax=marine sediment metagenome TaxID=412755 RepID=A0A0F9I4T0_9ZZZZ
MKVYVYKVYGDYDEEDVVSKVFDSKEKAEKWNKRMHELIDLHNKYHRDGTVTRSGGSTLTCPEIIALMKESCTWDGYSGGYIGDITERELE